MKKPTKFYYCLIVALLAFSFFSSCKKEKVPVISTNEITNITGTTAISGGNITDEGSSTIIVRGICWSTGLTPSTADSKTIDWAGAGSFSSTLSGLNGATVYYVRAYATNSIGTAYGMAMSFTTVGQSPSPTISNATNINRSSATLNGLVNSNYLSTVVTFEFGINTSYGTNIVSDQCSVSGNTNTNVSATCTGLSPATLYHYRIKAINSLGTSYSSDMTFTTPDEEILLIEEFTNDPTGVVFKIVNDLDSAFYRAPNEFVDLFKIKIDSVCLKKFMYNGIESPLTNNYTWFTKKGQFVCWRYKYFHTSEPFDKSVDLILPNRHREISPLKFCFYRGSTVCTYESSQTIAFQRVFPQPINDTVHVKLSSLSFNKKLW